MKMTVLGRTGLTISNLGLGGVQFSKVSKRATANVIAAARDCGITFLETAYSYFDSEEKMGAGLRGKRHAFVLASKSVARDGKTIIDHLETSLRRLRTDHIDLYQLHGLDDKDDLVKALRPRGAVAALEKAKRQGKIASIGVTSHSLDLSLEMLKRDLFDSLQYPISLINTEVARSGLLRLARTRNVGLIAMKPLGGGRLGAARLALSYIYRHAGVVPVVGVETPEQVRELARIATKPTRLGPRDFERIRAIRTSVGRTYCNTAPYVVYAPSILRNSAIVPWYALL